MRDYLAVRSALCLMGWLALFVLPVPTRYAETETYFYFFTYWIGNLLLAIFLLRVVGVAVQTLLRPLAGLECITAVLYRWLRTAAVLLILPAAAGAIYEFAHQRGGKYLIRFAAAEGIAQFVPVAVVIAAGMRRGMSSRYRLIGILMGLSLEPLFDLVRIWIPMYGVWGWNNLIRQIVTDCVLILWTVYFLRREPEQPLPPPSATLQHWDRLTRNALRHRLPLGDEPEPVLQGARPRPSGREL